MLSTFSFSQVTEQWVKRYKGRANDFNVAQPLAVDAQGNVYVIGISSSIETKYDYITIKYDATGNVQWVREYNGIENGDDFASDIAIDAFGNVYVTGGSACIKYDTNGNEH